MAPEVLRVIEGHKEHLDMYGSCESDVYSFAVIMQEIATSDEPYFAYDLDVEGQSVNHRESTLRTLNSSTAVQAQMNDSNDWRIC